MCQEAYQACKDFWDADLPPIIEESFEVIGEQSELSSIEAVTLITAIEELMLAKGTDISFIDIILDENIASVTIRTMHEMVLKCGK